MSYKHIMYQKNIRIYFLFISTPSNRNKRIDNIFFLFQYVKKQSNCIEN
jgi:hypothetical protein